jgi:hypothetical protein
MEKTGGAMPDATEHSPDPEAVVRGERMQQWLEWMELCDELLWAGLRMRYKTEEEVVAAYRAWYKRTMDEHDQMIFHMASEFARRLGDGR